LIRGFDLKCSEERTFFFESFLEPEIGNFLCGGVDLLVIISVEFMVKDPLSLIDFGDILSDTGSDETILEPTIRSFHFALRLWREGIDDPHIAIPQNLLPLRSSLIGEQMVFLPEGVSSPDEAKDAVGVHIVGVRESILKDDSLEGQDMGPAGLCLHENGIKEEPAMIIQRSDQMPFLPRCGCPEMVRGIVLNELSDIAG
jgi:hypothetical protein